MAKICPIHNVPEKDLFTSTFCPECDEAVQVKDSWVKNASVSADGVWTFNVTLPGNGKIIPINLQPTVSIAQPAAHPDLAHIATIQSDLALALSYWKNQGMTIHDTAITGKVSIISTLGKAWVHVAGALSLGEICLLDAFATASSNPTNPNHVWGSAEHIQDNFAKLLKIDPKHALELVFGFESIPLSATPTPEERAFHQVGVSLRAFR